MSDIGYVVDARAGKCDRWIIYDIYPTKEHARIAQHAIIKLGGQVRVRQVVRYVLQQKG